MISKQIAFSIFTLFAAFTCEEEDVAIITGGTGVGPGNILSSTEVTTHMFTVYMLQLIWIIS